MTSTPMMALSRPSGRAAIAALALVVACGAAYAQTKVYRWVLPDGSIEYSDSSPGEGAVAGREIEVPKLQTVTLPPLPRRAENAGDDESGSGDDATGDYETVQVVSPKNDESIRENAGNVTIEAAVDPKLQPGHVLDIFVDGELAQSGRSSTVNITNLDRGTHSVEARVKDKKGKVIVRSKAVTFHLLRAAAAPRAAPAAGG